MTTPEWLERAARRGQSESWTLAHTFARYQQLENISEDALAQELGCTREAFLWMSLCRHPEGADFDEQVNAIAKRFAVDLMPLVQVIRHVDIVDALSQREPVAAHADGTIQMAARDRSRDEETSS